MELGGNGFPKGQNIIVLMGTKTTTRVLLDEAHFNGKKLNKSAKIFMLEAEGGENYLERCKRDPNLPIYLTGIIQSGDKPNRNNRIYPWHILRAECERYIREEIQQGGATGELDHPLDSSVPSLLNSSHQIVEMWFDDQKKDVWAKVKILNPYATPGDPALKARSLILNGVRVGISSRALGSIVEDEYSDHDEVDTDLEMVCWDLVSNASNFGSERLKVTESKQNKKIKLLTESQCIGGNCNVQSKKKITTIKDLKYRDLTESERTYLNILGVDKFLQIYKAH